MQSLKQNLTQFTWNKLLYCLWSNKAKIWACCCSKAWITWLYWACISWFCILSWLCCLSRSSLSFFFLQVFWSKFAILFKFFSKKTNHFWITLSTLLFYHQCHFHLASYVFLSQQISPFLFFSFFDLFFPDCTFWVSASVLRSLSSNPTIRSSRSCSFLESSSPLGWYLWLLVLYFYIRVVKWSPRRHTITANTS